MLFQDVPPGYVFSSPGLTAGSKCEFIKLKTNVVNTATWEVAYFKPTKEVELLGKVAIQTETTRATYTHMPNGMWYVHIGKKAIYEAHDFASVRDWLQKNGIVAERQAFSLAKVE
jgi:hypothetical protein